MSAFLFVADPDPRRREAFLATARGAFAPRFPGQTQGEVARGEAVLLWTAPSYHAPVHQDEGGVALLLGEALDPTQGVRLAPAALLPAWTHKDACSAPSFDGYHAALVLDAEGTLLLGADRLGLFPVYAWESGEVFLAGASPDAFRHHPLFRARLDRVALAGLLLTNGLVGGRTLWQDVRRLDAGHLLVRPRGGKARCARQYALPFSRSFHARSPEERLAAADAVLEDVYRRHAPDGERLGLQLSGGLDSRLAGAYLRGREPRTETITFGRVGDHDVRYARQVARALDLPHRTVDDAYEEFPACAGEHARWSHLASGFSLLAPWSRGRPWGEFPPRVHIGLVFDAVVGPYGWVDTVRRDRSPCDQVIDAIGSWGLAPDAIVSLFRRADGAAIVEEARASLRRVYDQVEVEEPFQRAHALYLLHRQRFHVGAVAWPTSFVRTPVLSVLDHRLLDCFLGMPESALMDRRLELALLLCRAPDLAGIPLAAHAKEAWSPVPRWPERVVRRVRALRHLRRRWLHRRGDPLRFQRLTDLDGEAWRAVRVAAEPGREAWHEVFHADALASLLPPPRQPLPAASRIGLGGGAARRNLVGLFLHAQQTSLLSQ